MTGVPERSDESVGKDTAPPPRRLGTCMQVFAGVMLVGSVIMAFMIANGTFPDPKALANGAVAETETVG